MVSIATTAHASGVMIVGQTTTYPDPAAAIAAAPEGAILLVSSGNYAGFTIDGRSLTVCAQPGATVRIRSGIQVSHLAPTQTVSLIDLEAQGADTLGEPSLSIIDCAGSVRVDGGSWVGGDASNPGAVGGAGVFAQDSSRVSFARARLQGGRGGLSCASLFGCANPAGGPGGTSVNSIVVAHGLAGLGGLPAPSPQCGGDGGAGWKLQGGELLLVGSTWAGNDGMEACTGLGNPVGGDGGDGLVVGSGIARLRDNVYDPGAAGCDAGGCGSDGVDVQVVAGTATNLSGLERRWNAPSVIDDSAGLPIRISGLAGDRVWILMSRRPDFSFSAALQDWWLVPVPSALSSAADVTFASTGTLSATVPIPKLGPLEQGAMRYLQLYVIDEAGALHAGPPLDLVVLNADGV